MKKCPKPLGYGIRRTPVVLGLSAALCMPAAFSYANVDNGMDCESVLSVMQGKTIKGQILDETGESMIGVSVLVKGTTIGTVTDFDGNYTLEVPSGKNILEISYIGYKTKEITIGNNSLINIKMEPDTQALDEVVVIGYGTVKKRDLTGAVASMKNEDVTVAPTSNVMEALQGKIAGMDIVKSSGQVGEDVSILLRGSRSIYGSNEPLFIIDGIPGSYSQLRAIYYFNAVEQFGGVTMLTEPETTLNYAPERTDPLTIYKEVIIPDLEYAVEWLAVGTHATTTVPTKKAALGFLAKACLQTYEYGSTEYLQKALDSAKELIADCESGGAKYNAYMYPTYEEVFKESNNWENKEALWKHRWYAGSDGHGSSNGNYKLNRNDEYFLCNVNKFGAREDNQETRLTWEGCISGIFMPTQHLLNLYVQEDGTLDPRFHESFTTEWNANKNYIWDTSAANMYDKDESIVGTELKKGDLAIKFVMPQDEDYAEEKANRHTSNYLMIAYDDVYNDQKHNVNMQYNGMENQFRYFYPSLNKHNSSNYYVANASKKRNGNLNATFMMRMAEVYLIAAEADILINGGANAMGYINKVRARAGAKALTGTATVRTVLDERGRELCGEYCRFYDLKRTGMFKSSNYLEETHPDLAQFFNPNYALRPISTTFTATISNGAEYQNPGY